LPALGKIRGLVLIHLDRVFGQGNLKLKFIQMSLLLNLYGVLAYNSNSNWIY